MVDGMKQLAIEETVSSDSWYLEPITRATILHPSPAICRQVRTGNRVIETGPSEDTLTERNFCHGHRNIYNHEMMSIEFIAAGLRIEFFGCDWMKQPLELKLEAQWSPVQLLACITIGERYPDIAAELVVVTKKAAE